MAHVDVKTDVALDEPTLIEGLPGVGLVGKIAVDHLVDRLGMTYHAGVYCEGLPRVAVYREDDADVVPPVRLYADAEHDLLALQSDVPVSPESASEFATCLTDWFEEHDVTPIFLSGLPTRENSSGNGSGEETIGVDGGAEAGDENVADRALYGVATGTGADRLERTGIDGPAERGYISGPTGALVARAEETGLASLALVVEAAARFPDPAAAKRILDAGVLPLIDAEMDTAPLLDDAEEIRQARQRLARQMEQADTESTQAQPMGMFQ
jgi:uncharacterized protein